MVCIQTPSTDASIPRGLSEQRNVQECDHDCLPDQGRIQPPSTHASLMCRS
jgi:hypothetical protein